MFFPIVLLIVGIALLALGTVLKQNNDRNETSIKFYALLSKLSGVVCLCACLGFSSFVYVSDVGVLTKKIGGGNLKPGRVIAADGECGVQARILGPGWHCGYWRFQYDIRQEKTTIINPGMVGVITVIDGDSLPEGAVYAPEWKEPDKMLDGVYFLGAGHGYRGPQLTVLTPGQYRINTELFRVIPKNALDVKPGYVAVIKSNVGDIDPNATPQGIVKKGFRGIWNTPLPPGQYYLHPDAYQKIDVCTLKQTVNFIQEGHDPKLDHEPIQVLSRDGFSYPMDYRLIRHIEPHDAPLVVACVGDDEAVDDRIIAPITKAEARNIAEKLQALDSVTSRSLQEAKAFQKIGQDIAKYGITLDALNIGKVGDEKTLGALLKTQTDRQIAAQQITTYARQREAAEKEKELNKTVQEAVEEKTLATAKYDVMRAKESASAVIERARGDAEQIRMTLEARAKGYAEINKSIGPQGTMLTEVAKILAERNVRIVPDVMMISGPGPGDGSAVDVLAGTVLRGLTTGGMDLKLQPAVAPAPSANSK